MKKLLLVFLLLTSTAHAASDYTVTAKERDVIGDRVNVQITVAFTAKTVDGKGVCTSNCDLVYDRYVPITDWIADPQAVTAQMADFIVSKNVSAANQEKPGVPDTILNKAQVDAKIAVSVKP